MPAPAVYQYVPDQLRELALDAKERGLSFDEWWEEACRPRRCPECGTVTLRAVCPREWPVPGEFEPVRCGRRLSGRAPVTPKTAAAHPRAVVWPTDAVERRAWLGAVDDAREGWRDAYEGNPAQRRHNALARLREDLRNVDTIEDLAAGGGRSVGHSLTLA